MRKDLILDALTSFRRLAEIIDHLTDQEVLHTIELEESVQRRSSMLDRLYREARKRARNKFAR